MPASTITANTKIGTEFVSNYNSLVANSNSIAVDLATHKSNTSNPHNTTAIQIPFTANTVSNISINATNVQNAIEETYAELNVAKFNRSGDNTTFINIAPNGLFVGNNTVKNLVVNSNSIQIGNTSINQGVLNVYGNTYFYNVTSLINVLDVYSATGTSAPSILLRHSRGTVASPLHANTNDVLGSITFGSFYNQSVLISATATENHSGTAGGSGISISTMNTGTTALTQKLSMSANGNFTFANSITGTTASFSGSLSSGNFTSVGTLSTYGQGGNNGAGRVILNQAANRFLDWDGTNYNLPGANLLVNGSKVATIDVQNIFTVDQTISKTYPTLNLNYPNVLGGQLQVRENGRLYWKDGTSDEEYVSFGIDGSINSKQFGDLNSRINNVASAAAATAASTAQTNAQNWAVANLTQYIRTIDGGTDGYNSVGDNANAPTGAFMRDFNVALNGTVIEGTFWFRIIQYCQGGNWYTISQQ